VLTTTQDDLRPGDDQIRGDDWWKRSRIRSRYRRGGLAEHGRRGLGGDPGPVGLDLEFPRDRGSLRIRESIGRRLHEDRSTLDRDRRIARFKNAMHCSFDAIRGPQAVDGAPNGSSPRRAFRDLQCDRPYWARGLRERSGSSHGGSGPARLRTSRLVHGGRPARWRPARPAVSDG
jgi:hypothetical protein